MKLLVGRDLSPFDPAPTSDEAGWLEEVQHHLHTSEHVIRLGEPAADDEEDHVVRCDQSGHWHCGRYIGEIRFSGRTLRIEPRLGMPAIERLLAGAANLLSVPESAAGKPAESFIARLMAAVWCRSLDEAARHGPPAFRRQTASEGLHVRGNLDVRRTASLRGAGSPHVASALRIRDLDNDVTRALVCATAVLTRHIGDDRWQTRRAREVVPLLCNAVGARPRLPTETALGRVRYTPITRPYQTLAALSARIARAEGFAAADAPGTVDGLLLDIAELWELHVLRAMRAAAREHEVIHGTRDRARVHLLNSRDEPGRGLGRLLPDVRVDDRDGHTLLIADAKYKRLADSAERPNGVDRGDLYQLTSYLSRFAADGAGVGALIYPEGDDRRPATAERLGPWLSQAGHEVWFLRLPLDDDQAGLQLARLIKPPVDIDVASPASQHEVV